VRGILPVQLSPEALVQSLQRIAGEVLIVSHRPVSTLLTRSVSAQRAREAVVELLAQGLRTRKLLPP